MTVDIFTELKREDLEAMTSEQLSELDGKLQIAIFAYVGYEEDSDWSKPVRTFMRLFKRAHTGAKIIAEHGSWQITERCVSNEYTIRHHDRRVFQSSGPIITLPGPWWADWPAVLLEMERLEKDEDERREVEQKAKQIARMLGDSEE